MLICLMLTGTAIAESPTACVRIENAEQRLACYDALFMPQQDLERLQRERFGAEQMPRNDSAASAPLVNRITSTVSELTDHTRKRRGYKLANGQHWVQVSARYLTIRQGDEITITRGRLGGYTLSNSRGAATKVQRID